MSTPVTSYTELMAGIQAQVGALGLKLTDFDDLAGFPAGLSGKVFGPAQVKRLGPEKLFDALRAAGLRLRVEVDPEQEAKMKLRIADNYNPRQANQARLNNHASTVSTQVLSRAFGHILREARKKRWAGKSKKERSEHARMIANARWKKERKRRKAGHQRRMKAREATRRDEAVSVCATTDNQDRH
jgi:hypothetical protein